MSKELCRRARREFAELAGVSTRKVPPLFIVADRADLDLDGNNYELDRPSLVISSPEFVLQRTGHGAFRLYDVTGESFVLCDPSCLWDRNLARAFLASLQGVEVPHA